MAPYTTVIGCRVTSVDSVPEGMVHIKIPEGKYERFVAKGKGDVFRAWQEIWQADHQRSYGADYELYKDITKDGEVEIFLGTE